MIELVYYHLGNFLAFRKTMKDFKLKQPVIRLTNLRLKHPVILLTDLKLLPRTIILQDWPDVTIKNDLGKATNNVNESEDDKNTQNCHIVEGAVRQQTGHFDENDDFENVNVTKSDESIICNLCRETFINRSAFVNHFLNCHNNDLIFLCAICDARFKSEEELRKHLFIHEKGNKWKKCNFVKTEDSFICNTCEISYEKKSDLLEHITKLHTRRLPFPCKKCKMPFSKKCRLKKHLKKHKYKKKYVCSICSCYFLDRPALKDHINVHIGEKFFKCSTCRRGFRSWKILQKHTILAHTGKTTYKCSKCDASFTRKFILIEHMQQIVCRKCRRVFRCKTNFDEHGENCYQLSNRLSWQSAE